MKKYLFFYLLVLSLSITACGDDEGDINNNDDCNTSFNLASELQIELDNLNAAATTFSNDPTSENCSAYKNADQAYVDAIRSYESCAEEAGQEEQFRTAVDSGQATVDAITC